MFSAWHNPAARMFNTDLLAVLMALSLPWSTSLVAIFSVCWLAAVVLTLDWGAFLRFLKQPICALPLGIVALAAIGTLWSDAAWGTRFYYIGPATKLLFLPLLFYHFQRSTRGMWVLTAFLVSCALLMVVSWLVLLEPDLAIRGGDPQRGVFVKNYIDQGQSFALCALTLAYPIFMLLRERRIWPALALLAIVFGMLANMAFVIVSRTAMVTMPVLLAVFAVLHLRWRTSLMIFAGLVLLAVVSFAASSQLQWTVNTFLRDYELYKERDIPTSIGLRLEYWQKSLRFIGEAPLAGHGTGSTRGLFESARVGTPVDASGQAVANPHNQTFAVAIQWGVIGVVILYAMWLVHLLLFRGEGFVAWVGLLVVVQNILSSLFNSHLFDFHEGWMYVLGVGVAGGMVLGAREQTRPEQA
ncbi:MAG: O-antigen ligase family protein [Bradyrhizobium sp.]|nr:O-antigen ligase family protein [Bradyrhizobium sp.]